MSLHMVMIMSALSSWVVLVHGMWKLAKARIPPTKQNNMQLGKAQTLVAGEKEEADLTVVSPKWWQPKKVTRAHVQTAASKGLEMLM